MIYDKKLKPPSRMESGDNRPTVARNVMYIPRKKLREISEIAKKAISEENAKLERLEKEIKTFPARERAKEFDKLATLLNQAPTQRFLPNGDFGLYYGRHPPPLTAGNYLDNFKRTSGKLGNLIADVVAEYSVKGKVILGGETEKIDMITSERLDKIYKEYIR